jgi:hypothetical protein
LGSTNSNISRPALLPEFNHAASSFLRRPSKISLKILRENVASGIQPPEGPKLHQPTEKNLETIFPFMSLSGESHDDDDYGNYQPGNDFLVDHEGNRIKSYLDWEAPEPGLGYVLRDETINSYEGITPDKNQPSVGDAEVGVVPNSENKYYIRLKNVNFEENAGIRFEMRLIWVHRPSDALKAEQSFKDRMAEYDDAVQEQMHLAYVEAVRERVRLASNVGNRPYDELREEERNVVFRRVVKQLAGAAADRELPHVISELVTRLFDTD